jgi:N-acylneuraminate cytidylyltransferase
LVGKNIKPLNGKPLLHYTLEAVLRSNRFEKVILSSDDDLILDVGSRFTGLTLEKRDPSLAGDKVKVVDLIKNIASRDGYADKYDKIGLFLPTCPFRTAKHIQEGIALLTEDDFSVISVTEMEDSVQLSLSLERNNTANLEALIRPSPLVTGETRSQDFKRLHRVNGGFYISWIKKFIEKDNFFQGTVKCYEMSRLHSVDIDYPINLEWAEYLLKNGHVEILS